VVAGISASDTTTDGYNKTPEAYRSPYMAATSRTTQSFRHHPRPLRPTALSTFRPVAQPAMQDLVWQGTSNRWDTWRISFGGDKGWARASCR
jgi:hypothetical protein